MWCGTISLSILHTEKTGMIMVLIEKDKSHLKMTKQLSKSRSIFVRTREDTLEQHITWQNILTEEHMIHNFVIAEAFVNDACRS